MSILTNDELREHVETSLSDDALDRLIASNEAELNEWAGVFVPAVTTPAPAPIANVTETIFLPGTSVLSLRQAPDPEHVESVTVYYSPQDDGREIETTEYYLRGSGLYQALPGGYWPWKTVVVYRPLDSLAVRKMALVDLCKLDLATNFGLSSIQIGDWAESYASGPYGVEGYEAARSAIKFRVYDPAPFA